MDSFAYVLMATGLASGYAPHNAYHEDRKHRGPDWSEFPTRKHKKGISTIFKVMRKKGQDSQAAGGGKQSRLRKWTKKAKIVTKNIVKVFDKPTRGGDDSESQNTIAECDAVGAFAQHAPEAKRLKQTPEKHKEHMPVQDGHDTIASPEIAVHSNNVPPALRFVALVYDSLSSGKLTEADLLAFFNQPQSKSAIATADPMSKKIKDRGSGVAMQADLALKLVETQCCTMKDATRVNSGLRTVQSCPSSLRLAESLPALGAKDDRDNTKQHDNLSYELIQDDEGTEQSPEDYEHIVQSSLEVSSAHSGSRAGGTELDMDSASVFSSSSEDSESSSETSDNVNDDKDQDDETRAIWGPILDIADDSVKQLTLAFMDRPISEISDIRTTSGQNNRIFIVTYEDDYKVCVRVPANGYNLKWTLGDRKALLNSVSMMKFLAAKTKIPVPRIFHYDTGLDNEINAPYIAMQHLPGAPPLSIWYGQKGDGTSWKTEETEEAVDTVLEVYFEDRYSAIEYHPLSNELERKRQAMLESLARYMAEFRRLGSFDMLGSPIFSKDGSRIESIGPMFEDHYGMFAKPDCTADYRYEHNPAEPSMEAYLRKLLAEWDSDCRATWIRQFEKSPPDDDSRRGLLAKHEGQLRFMRLLISCLPTDSEMTNLDVIHQDKSYGERNGSSKPFVLTVPDAGSHNLLCDPDTGIITGIIDWDRAWTTAKYLGWCLPPDWLVPTQINEDIPEFPLARQTMAVEDMERYRKDFAKYLQQACETGSEHRSVDDFKYTSKAHIFKSIVESIRFGDLKAVWGVVDRIVADLFPRADKDQFLEELMSRVDVDDEDSGMTKMLKARIRRYFGFATTEEIRHVL